MSERDPLQARWTRQQQEPFAMTAAQQRQRVTRFQSKIRTRNRIEYAAAALVIGVFAWMVVIITEPMVRAGAGLIILGTLYVCWKLHTLAGWTMPPASRISAAPNSFASGRPSPASGNGISRPSCPACWS